MGAPFRDRPFPADTLSRVIYGSRVTLLMGMLAVLAERQARGRDGGLPRRPARQHIMRVMESIAVIPFLLIAVLAAASGVHRDGFSYSDRCHAYAGFCVVEPGPRAEYPRQRVS